MVCSPNHPDDPDDPDLGAGPTALINPEITRRTRADRIAHSVVHWRINGPTVARPHQI